MLEQACVGGLGRAVAGQQAGLEVGLERRGDRRRGGGDQAVADVGEAVLARAEREAGEDGDLAAADGRQRFERVLRCVELAARLR